MLNCFWNTQHLLLYEQVNTSPSSYKKKVSQFKQGAHGPQRSLEKTVQIDKHI